MPVDTTHPEYAARHSDWQTVRHALAGQTTIKAQREIYLPMPGSLRTAQEAAQKASKKGPYDNYLARARFPDWTENLLTGMLGLVFEVEPAITVPDRLKNIIESATPAGDSLDVLLRRVISECLQTGRYGLLVDINDDQLPVMCGYSAESIINWRQSLAGGSRYLSLAVLAEQYLKESTDEYATDYDTEYLVLHSNNSEYSAERIRVHDEGDIVTELDSPDLSEIPFIFFGSRDLTPKPDAIPLLPIARAALKYYELSADYYNTLYYTSAPQYVVTGINEDEKPTAIGPAALWAFDSPQSDAKILEFSGEGAEAQRLAMQDAKAEAFEAGARVMDRGNSTESGESRKQRRADQHANLKTVVETVRRGMIQALEYAADIVGVTGDINIQINTDFDDASIDAALITALNTTVSSANAPKEVLFDHLRAMGLTTRTDEELKELIMANAGDLLRN